MLLPAYLRRVLHPNSVGGAGTLTQLQNHEAYLQKVMVLTSEFSTMTQIEESYQNATGKPIPAIPGPFGWLLVKINKATQDL